MKSKFDMHYSRDLRYNKQNLLIELTRQFYCHDEYRLSEEVYDENEEVLFKLVHYQKKYPIKGIAPMKESESLSKLCISSPSAKTFAEVMSNRVIFKLWKSFTCDRNSPY